MAQAYIVAATRTAGGKRGGKLSGWHPADLAAQVLDELVRRSQADPAQVEDVIMGCVSQVGQQATNVARNAVLASSLPESVPGTTVDRQCGSSQQALHFAAQAVMSGSMDMVIAAGVESMSRVPIGMPISLPAMPHLALMGVLVWAMLQPGLMPPWLAFCIGMLADLLFGQPLGVNATLFAFATGVMRMTGRVFGRHGSLFDWLLVTGEKSDKVGTYAVSAAGALKRVGEAASGKGALWIEVLHTSAN